MNSIIQGAVALTSEQAKRKYFIAVTHEEVSIGTFIPSPTSPSTLLPSSPAHSHTSGFFVLQEYWTMKPGINNVSAI